MFRTSAVRVVMVVGSLLLLLSAGCNQTARQAQVPAGSGSAGAAQPATAKTKASAEPTAAPGKASDNTKQESKPGQDLPLELDVAEDKQDGPGEIPGAKVPVGSGYYYTLYAGSYEDEPSALKAIEKLKLLGFKGEMVKTTILLVRIAVTDDYDQLKATMNRMDELGFPEAFVTRKKGEMPIGTPAPGGPPAS